jgi:putative ABC transport system permease protein
LAGPQPQTIVGVARDVRSFGLDAAAASMVYFPTPAAARWNPMSIVIRTAGDPTAIVPSARGVLRSIDPTIPFYNVRRAEELLENSMGPRRFMLFLVSCFATVALATIGAACGIGGAYGMTPLLESFLFGVKALDPLTFTVAPLLLVAIAAPTC